MQCTNKKLSFYEKSMFDQSMHLYSTNNLVGLHNRKMLKLRNLPVILSIAIKTHLQPNLDSNVDRLPKELLLCKGQRTMLTTNLWIQMGLVNGSLWEVVDIVYTPGCKPPDLPLYVVV